MPTPARALQCRAAMRRLLPLLLVAAGCGNSSTIPREIPYQPPPYTAPPDMALPGTTPPTGDVGANETQLLKAPDVRPLGVDYGHNAYWVTEGSGGGAVWTASLDYPQSARVVMPRTTLVTFTRDVILGWNTVRGASATTTTLVTNRLYPSGYATIATNAVPGIAATDGEWLAFADGLSSDGTSADIYLSKVDGSARTRVLTAVNVGAGCVPQLELSYRMVVASTCSAGGTSATISLVDATTAAVTTLKSGVLPGFQHRGSLFLFNDATASYYTIGQSSNAVAVMLDKPLQLPVMAGKMLVYAVGKQLRGVDTMSYGAVPRDVALLPDAPVQLVASPDGAQIAYWTHAGETHDLALVATATGVSRPLRADFATFAGFTDDSAYALLLENVDSASHGALVAVPVAAGPARTLAATVASVQPARASKLLYTEIGRDDVSALRLVDLALDRAPVTLAKMVDVTGFATDTDRSRVVYSRSKAPEQGLYYSAIP